MEHDTAACEFVEWLQANKLDSYRHALEAEGEFYDCYEIRIRKPSDETFALGYDMLESLTIMSDTEIGELSIAIKAH
jgi:hypothetical protein